MTRELSWHELRRMVEEHEGYHNFAKLKTFCELYYPKATKITVQPIQEYDDYNYYFSFGPSSVIVAEGDRELSLPDDDVSLLVLLAQSPKLNNLLTEAKPENPVLWLADVYYEDICDLELYGIERGYDIEVDFSFPPSSPREVYVEGE